APAQVFGMHAVAVAIPVVAGLGTGAAGAHIRLRIADQHVGHLVVAPEAAQRQAAVGFPAEGLHALHIALEQHHAGRLARTVPHALRSLEDGDAVVGFGIDVGGGRVHAPAATAIDLLA